MLTSQRADHTSRDFCKELVGHNTRIHLKIRVFSRDQGRAEYERPKPAAPVILSNGASQRMGRHFVRRGQG